MQCTKCGRKSSDKSKMCIYCGAPLDKQTPSQTYSVVKENSHIFISSEQKKEVKAEDLPESDRHKIEEAIRKGNNEVIVKTESTIVKTPLASENKVRSALSFGKILAMLAKMKESLNAGQIENSVYDKMVTGIIKDYISTLDDDTQLDFVVNKAATSELSDFLNEKILNDLKMFVISSVSDKKKM